jgi:hypothetical protein
VLPSCAHMASQHIFPFRRAHTTWSPRSFTRGTGLSYSPTHAMCAPKWRGGLSKCMRPSFRTEQNPRHGSPENFSFFSKLVPVVCCCTQRSNKCFTGVSTTTANSPGFLCPLIIAQSSSGIGPPLIHRSCHRGSAQPEHAHRDRVASGDDPRLRVACPGQLQPTPACECTMKM